MAYTYLWKCISSQGSVDIQSYFIVPWYIYFNIYKFDITANHWHVTSNLDKDLQQM